MTGSYLVLQVYLLISTLEVGHSPTFPLLLLVPFISGILILWKFPKYYEPASAILSTGGYLIGMLYEQSRIEYRSPSTTFFLGYAYAMVQRIVQSHLAHYHWVLFAGLAMMIARSLIITFDQPYIFAAHIFVDIFALAAAYKAELTDRSIFQSMNNLQLQLMKFKDLLVDLPLNIVVISKNLKDVHFSNTFFMNNFGKFAPKTNPLIFLDKFKVRDPNPALLT